MGQIHVLDKNGFDNVCILWENLDVYLVFESCEIIKEIIGFGKYGLTNG